MLCRLPRTAPPISRQNNAKTLKRICPGSCYGPGSPEASSQGTSPEAGCQPTASRLGPCQARGSGGCSCFRTKSPSLRSLQSSAPSMKAQGMLGSGPRLPCEWAASGRVLSTSTPLGPLQRQLHHPHAAREAFPAALHTTDWSPRLSPQPSPHTRGHLQVKRSGLPTSLQTA